MGIEIVVADANAIETDYEGLTGDGRTWQQAATDLWIEEANYRRFDSRFRSAPITEVEWDDHRWVLNYGHDVGLASNGWRTLVLSHDPQTRLISASPAVRRLESLIDEFGEPFTLWADEYCVDTDEPGIEEQFLSSFQGEWDNVESWADDQINDLYAVPESIRSYVDAARWAEDYRASGKVDFITMSTGAVAVFWTTW